MDESMITQKRNLQRWYNKTGPVYDTQFGNEDHLQEMAGIERLVFDLHASKVLSVGTGTSEDARLLTTGKDLSYFGVDIAREMLIAAREKLDRIDSGRTYHLVQADAVNLPFPDAFFDLLLCIGVMEYFPIDYVSEIMLAEFNRVTRRSAFLIIDFPVSSTPQAEDFKKKSEGVGTKVYLYDLPKLKRILQDSKLEIVKHQVAAWENQFVLRKM
jgi:ubiquinone/menaquinone biosynthesis C-methylase UbiE